MQRIKFGRYAPKRYGKNKKARIHFVCSIFAVLLSWNIFNQNIKEIETKKHVYKVKSIFKCGLNYISERMINSKLNREINVFNFLLFT